MEQSDIPVFIGIGNDNQPVTTKITSINFACLLNEQYFRIFATPARKRKHG